MTIIGQTSGTGPQSVTTGIAGWVQMQLQSMRRDEPAMYAAAIAMAALSAVLAFALLVDARTVNGINAWIKPLKFAVSLLVYSATLAWFARYLPDGLRDTWRYRAFSMVVFFCIVAEMAWITGASAMGVGSHFNQSNSVLAVLYPLMGFAATVLTALTLVQGIAILRRPPDQLRPAIAWSIGLGLALTFVLTMATAWPMAAGISSAAGSAPGHWVGGVRSDAGGLAVMGWARDGGDLRVAHFFATHAMHFIPAFGLVAAFALGQSGAKRAIAGFALLFSAFVVWTLAQALSGKPFLAFLA